ncbi:MAG: GMC family oxidoreductase [Pseudomonadota bacterium]
MIEDFREVAGAGPVEADLCIVGAGAAGVTLAREFAGARTRVVLLESGGFEYQPELQALYEGENVGAPYFPLDTTRLRFFGGTTNHWGGSCRPLDPIDFAARDWVPGSGWPLDGETLAPYYERAKSVCGLSSHGFDGRTWTRLGGAPRSPLSDHVSFSLRQRAKTPLFGSVYRDELAAAQNVRVLLNANLTDIRTDPGENAVTRLEVTTLQGARSQVRARCVVLACGGIENARLLLASNGVRPNGVGNSNDLVGRYFMEHLHVYTAEVTPIRKQAFLNAFMERWDASRQEFIPNLQLSDERQRRQRLLNAGVRMFLNYSDDGGLNALRHLVWGLKRRQPVDDLDVKLWRIARDFDLIAYNAYRQKVEHKFILPSEDQLKSIAFFVSMEQEPNPDSRITLSDERDGLGMRRSRLDWRLGEADYRTLREVTLTIGAELARAKLGRTTLAPELRDETNDFPEGFIHGGYHHMGTTRMSDDPKRGVVDADCRVHGLSNLYVAGSSVFPTAGYSAPTFTIVALALRLADHLKGALRDDGRHAMNLAG